MCQQSRTGTKRLYGKKLPSSGGRQAAPLLSRGRGAASRPPPCGRQGGRLPCCGGRRQGRAPAASQRPCAPACSAVRQGLCPSPAAAPLRPPACPPACHRYATGGGRLAAPRCSLAGCSTWNIVATATIHNCNVGNITFVNQITFVMVVYATIVMTPCLLYNCNTHRASGAHPAA